jgi:zinc/manganese transport system substrate-binding protein
LLRRAGSRNIQPGASGYFLAADYVRKLEVPTRLDRSEGDIHPQGNPHIQLNPHNIARVADKLSKRLASLDPASSAFYEARLADFQRRWADAISGWEERAKPMAGMRLVSHHLGLSYLADWLDLNIVTTLESKPGIPPTSKHLTELLEQLAPEPPAAIIRTPYSNEKPSLWLARRLNVPALVLPSTVDSSNHPADLFELFTSIIDALKDVRR